MAAKKAAAKRAPAKKAAAKKTTVTKVGTEGTPAPTSDTAASVQVPPPREDGAAVPRPNG